ncbi:hypothetical protein FHQ08_12765 [Lactobacillus sp. CC-MHH1034]|nr:hypothetical protein [Agrilactobacillus fermenti]
MRRSQKTEPCSGHRGMVDLEGAGIDGLTVDELLPYLKQHRDELIASLRDGSYQPLPVKRVEIPKPDGSKRKLGIPTVVDRLVQQAVAQVMSPRFEKIFSDSSFGFRPNRSAHDAIKPLATLCGRAYALPLLTPKVNPKNFNLKGDPT